MAQNYINTGTQAGNFEDLVNFITRVSWEDTPVFTSAGRTKAKAILHEWMTQALADGASNARAEGYAPSFAAGDITARVRRTNPVQIIAKPFSVSGSQDAVNKAGLGMTAEYEEQKDLKLKELAKDADFELIRNTRVTRDADAGTAGEFDGLLLWASGSRNVEAAASPLTATLSEDLYNQVAQAIYTTSGQKADRVYCNGFQKRTITRWSTPIRRMGDEKTYTNAVNQYDGDWGTQMIVFDPAMPTDEVLIVKMSVAKVAYLRPVEHYELGRTVDERRGYVLSELSLEITNPNAVGRITRLTQSA